MITSNLMIYIFIFIFTAALIYLLYTQSNHNIIPSLYGDKAVITGTNTKPILWIYIPDETNITNWKTFLSRYRDEKQLAIYRICLTSLILHNGDDFHLVLLHKDNIKYYLPDFKLPPNASNTNMNAMKFSILHEYGGVFLPIHTLVFKSFTKLYESGMNKNISTIMFGNVNSNIILSKKNSPLSKELSEYYTTRRDGLGGGSAFDTVPTEILDRQIKKGTVALMNRDLLGHVDYEGREILSNRYVSTNTTKFRDENVIAHVLNLQSFDKDQYLMRMSEAQIKYSDMWISKLTADALKYKHKNLVYMPGNEENWRKPECSTVYY
jgi:hypothetical protein